MNQPPIAAAELTSRATPAFLALRVLRRRLPILLVIVQHPMGWRVEVIELACLYGADERPKRNRCKNYRKREQNVDD